MLRGGGGTVGSASGKTENNRGGIDYTKGF